MWVTLSLPRISTSPFVRVVFPVAESPTTPRMIGRAMCCSPLVRVAEARNLSAKSRFGRVSVTKLSGATQLRQQPAGGAHQRRERRQRERERRQHRVAADLAHEVGLPQREVAPIVAVARAA